VAEVLDLALGGVRAGYGLRRILRRAVPFRVDTYLVGEHLIWGRRGAHRMARPRALAGTRDRDGAGGGEGRRVVSSHTLAALLIVAATMLAGCARGDDGRAVGAVTERFAQALQRGDGRAACELLSPAAVLELESREGERCAQAIGDVRVEAAPVTRAQVYVVSAKVDLANGESAFLSATRDGWRLDAVACRPQSAKPADLPYDCELEA
jgi:hypothetical protein